MFSSTIDFMNIFLNIVWLNLLLQPKVFCLFPPPFCLLLKQTNKQSEIFSLLQPPSFMWTTAKIILLGAANKLKTITQAFCVVESGCTADFLLKSENIVPLYWPWDRFLSYKILQTIQSSYIQMIFLCTNLKQKWKQSFAVLLDQ